MTVLAWLFMPSRMGRSILCDCQSEIGRVIAKGVLIMKNKRILTGILGLVLVFGLGMVLASCELEKTAEISVTNASSFENDATVTVRVYMQGRGDPLATREVSRNQTETFSLEEGEYQVRVTSGSGSSFYFPQDNSFMKMSGDVKLRYGGNSVTRN